ncbi:hypothetical protein PAMP_010207 [Pampus punctatissimus]
MKKEKEKEEEEGEREEGAPRVQQLHPSPNISSHFQTLLVVSRYFTNRSAFPCRGELTPLVVMAFIPIDSSKDKTMQAW